MSTIRDLIGRALELEPTLVISTISGLLLIAANFGLPTAGVDVPSMVAAVFNLLTIAAAILGIRQSVYSPATHGREVAEAAGYESAP